MSLGFGHGAIDKDEWQFIEDQCKKFGFKTVIEVGSGFSTINFMNIVDHIDSYETDNFWIDKLIPFVDKSKVNIVQYTYPNFPKNENKYDVAFVDRPGQNNSNGRKNSMEFVKPLVNYVFIHDFGRKNERLSTELVFNKSEWENLDHKKRILLIKRK